LISKMTNNQVAVMDSVIGGLDDQHVFERARWAGYGGVEATLSADDLKAGRGRLGSLERAAETTGLVVTSLVLDHHNLGGIADANPRVAADAVEDVRQAIAWAAQLGATAILIPFFGHAELLTDSARLRAIAAFRALSGAAAAAGVSLLYEGPLPAQEVLQLAESIGSPAFGCYFDTANLVFRGLDPPTEIRRLGPLVERIHIKDVLARKGDVHPGRGRVNFDECARALSDIGYTGWLVLETPPGPPPLAARDLSFVRTVLGTGEAGFERWPAYGALVDDPLARIAPALEAAGVSTVVPTGPSLDTALADPGATRRLLASSNLGLAALEADGNLVARDTRIRDAGVARVAHCLEAAPALGTWVVSTGTGSRIPEAAGSGMRDWASDDAWSALCDSVERLLPSAEQRDVVLALRGSSDTVLKTPSQVILLLERYPSPSLQVVADPYSYLNPHLLPAQERVSREFLDLFEDRFVLARLDDVAASNGSLSRPAFGLGEFAQRPYLDFLRERRPDLPLVFDRLPLAEVPAAVARAEALVDAS
jgi:sugar phosphate isomerase/epimerase